MSERRPGGSTEDADESADAETDESADAETDAAAGTETDAAADTETDAAAEADAAVGTDAPEGRERHSAGAGGEGGTDRSDARVAETPVAPTTQVSSSVSDTDHWIGVGAFAFAAAGLGVLVQSRPLLLCVVVTVGYLAYADAFTAPEVTLAVAHRLSDADPDPGDEVTVTVVVENAGESTLSDLRVLDHVPDALEVVDGPARTATALRPGARATFSYTVRARRGEYSFEGLTVVARTINGSVERVVELETARAGFACTPPLDTTTTVPLQSLTSPYTGRVSTDSSGEGVEFASLREFRRGDALSRIDWNRYARDGELATQEFREERMATVVVLLDLRDAAYLLAGDDGRHAVDRSIDAAGRLVHSLLDTGDRVGVAALSASDVWLAPGAGSTHRARVRHLLATHPALSPTPPDERFLVNREVRTLASRLPEDAQLILVSPVPDDQSVYVARALTVRGHPVTVVSPDPTRTETVGQQLAQVRRSNRLNDLRTSGVRVVDWGEESLTEAIDRASRRWSG